MTTTQITSQGTAHHTSVLTSPAGTGSPAPTRGTAAVPTANRVAVAAAATAVLAWAAKAVAIGVAGGLDKSPLEQPFFLLGLVAFVTAVCALGISVVRGWPARIAAVVGGVVGTVLVTALTGWVIEAVVGSDHWAWYEANLWIISTAVLGISAWLARRRRSRD